jgi:hypothetical protein
MNERSKRDDNDASAPAMRATRLLSGASDLSARRMSLEGREALDLYLAEIGRNLSALGANAVLLQATLRKAMDAMRELQSCPVGSTSAQDQIEK